MGFTLRRRFRKMGAAGPAGTVAASALRTAATVAGGGLTEAVTPSGAGGRRLPGIHMAVLIVSPTLVIRQDSMLEKLPGRWRSLQQISPADSLYGDDELAAVFFRDSTQAQSLLQRLVELGFQLPGETGGDLVMADQHEGLSAPCDWLEFARLRHGSGRISVCWFHRGPRIAAGLHLPGLRFSIAAPPGISPGQARSEG